MGYCDTTHVAALCSQIVSGSADFGTNTNPTKAQVQFWISSGCALLDTVTKGKGYAPPASTNSIYDLYRNINALYAAWMSEKKRTVDQTAPGSKTRAQQFYDDLRFHFQMLFGSDLDALDLASAGLAVTNTAGPWGGGINVTDVENEEDAWADGTTVPPRFTRGQMSHGIGTLLPSKVSSTG